MTVTWQSVPNVTYLLEWATNAIGRTNFHPLATGIPGQPDTTTFLDTHAPTTGPCFYRVGVQP